MQSAPSWLALGRRAHALGWTWRPGMWALDDATTDMGGLYEVVAVDDGVVARRVRDGRTVPCDQVVPYLNDDGVTEGHLLERGRALRGDARFDVERRVAAAAGASKASSMGWSWPGGGTYGTRVEALVAAGELSAARPLNP